MPHPCLSCGACCAQFRVSFHWSETEPALGGVVPVALTEVLDPHRLAMRGTWTRQPRCIALDAEIGRHSRCTIHPQRPSTCRDMSAAWERGQPSPQCDRARAAYGLAALTPADWLALVMDGTPADAANDPISDGQPDDNDPGAPPQQRPRAA